MAEALTAQIEELRAAVDGAKDEAKLWRRAQRFSLNPGFVHFNCGSTGAPPRYVIDTVCRVAFGRNEPWSRLSLAAPGIGKVADFIGADVEEVA